MTSFLLRGGTLVELDPVSVERGDLRLLPGAIAERAEDLAPSPGEEVIDCTGKTLLPGLVCAHTHLYSALARGMPPAAKTPTDFPETLRWLWWRLDQALSRDGIRASGLLAGLEAVRNGTTLLLDHHASPNAIEGSLDVLREATEEIGLRTVLCYEVTDRGGEQRREAGLDENERLLRSAPGGLTRALVGAHASFTLSDIALERLGELARRFESGVHMHVAEDGCDDELSRERYGSGLIDRLERFGLLTERSVLAHNIHLSPEQLGLLRERKCWLIHNPRSNMNNAVGHAPIEHFGERGALGTDGLSPDMFEELRTAYFKARDSGRKIPMATLLQHVKGGYRLAGELFGLEFGRLRPSAAADVLVLDYDPPTPLRAENLAGHVIFGMNAGLVETVFVDGRLRLRDRRAVGLDEAELYREARLQAGRLWNAMETIPCD